jgi:NAD(P)-dependent dehydrogenase (short-subunit alcohol dehydrogenase family)
MSTENNKVAVITGGGSGLGFAMTKKFVEENIHTIIIGRDEKKLNAAKNVGHIDILVNNAGINMKKDFTEVSDEEFQRVLTTNLCSVFAISREVSKHMLTKGKGSIINISSMAAQYGIPLVVAYSASKTAIEGMTRAMAVELSPKGIRVNAIAPGFIVTAMTDAALNADPERKAKVFGRTPMGHMGQPSDIAETAFFLASDSAKYITGVVLPVDGGNSIGF